jgi:hypothetical protein
MSESRPPVTAREVARFTSEGFLVLRRVLDPTGVVAARDRIWEGLPERFRRDDARSWHGLVEDESGTRDLLDRKGRVKLRGTLRGDPALLALLPENPVIRATVATLLAPRAAARPQTVRGIYLTFPMPELPQSTGHVDLHDYAIGAVAYLDEVPRHGGGLLVWPGSHRDRSRPVDARQHEPSDDALELPGRAGDVVLYDRHLVHAPGRNRLPHVRAALLCDFRLAE